MNFELHVLRALKDNFIYAFVNGRACTILDPGDPLPVEEFLRQHSLQLARILLTHHHWDHVSGVPDLVAKWRPEVWCSAYDLGRIAGATHTAEGEFEICGARVRTLSLKGHTQGQIAYHFVDKKMIFVGDTLFSAGCGRLLEGTAEQMYASLQVLAALPPDTKVYFGHEYTVRNLHFVLHHRAAPRLEAENYLNESQSKLNRGEPTTPTTIATELKINPFLRSQSLAEFTRWRELRNAF